jgi:hypothetical protein
VSAQGASPSPRVPTFGSNLSKADPRWLLLLPLGVAAVFGVLLLPWSVVPEGVPLPVPDRTALDGVTAADRAAALRARTEPLSGPVRALGSALRAYHTLEAKHAEDRELGDARTAIDKEIPDAFRQGDDAVLALRAIELEGFLDEARHFEDTGRSSPELDALAGTFVQSMTNQGWCVGHTLLAGPAVLRVMYKEMWNGFVGVQGRPTFEPSLDEKRVLFAFYLAHPHPPTNARDQVDAMRRGARDAKDCAAADQLEKRSIERWRLERIGRIAAIDPDYPAAYARGVASYGAGAYEASVEAFRTWIQEHPDGPYTLRAQAFLRAAISAARID